MVVNLTKTTYCSEKEEVTLLTEPSILNRTLIMNLITWKDRKVFFNAQSSLSGMHLNSVDDVYNSQTDAPIQALNCTHNAEKMMCFLLNERTRELCGEGYRWEDLARTKTLEYARWHALTTV